MSSQWELIVVNKFLLNVLDLIKLETILIC